MIRRRPKPPREFYVRSDIPCGFFKCKSCSPPKPPPPSKLFVVPHPSALSHNMDLFNHAAFPSIVLLQTTLDAIRHSPLLYTKARSILNSPAHASSFVFSNEHHDQTATKKLQNESAAQRSDRAFMNAAKFLCDHAKPLNVNLVVVADDPAVLAAAAANNVPAASTIDYVNSIADKFPDLPDLVSSHSIQADQNDQKEKFIYPEHLSQLQISAGLKSNSFYQSTIAINPHNYLEATANILINNSQIQVLIIGRQHLNRAVHGDVVAIQLLPKSSWRPHVSAVIDQDDIEKETDLDGSSNETDRIESAINATLDVDQNESAQEIVSDLSDSAMQTDAPNPEDILSFSESDNLKPTAKVVGIIKRNWRPFCGTIDASSVHSSSLSSSAIQSVFFWPMDRKFPKIRIRTRQAPSLLGKRIVVAIDAWQRSSRCPDGHYLRTIGDVGDKSTETEVLLLEHDVPFAPFSPLVLSFLPEEGNKWVVRDEHLVPGREDLRHLDVCSIDPPGCTDIDDALHASPLPNGNFAVGVHIADVSHFVKPGNAMDLEAQRRGTTVYLVDKRIDMLPSLLGTNLCSLRSNVDRLAFSVLWEMTPNADVVNVRFTKSVIRSRASLTYDEAQARLDDPSMTDSVSTSIKSLNKLAKQLRSRRMANGALTLASPEVRFTLENDSQDPVDIELKQLKDTNALVEEFMLLANIYVAKHIHKMFPDTSVLRRHPKPPSTQFEDLVRAVSQRGITLDPSTSKSLADSLDRAVIPADPYFNTLLRIMTTRCMMQAVYFASGTLPYTDYWHYGLAMDIYTHFTSPIRRYADLIVHRLLAESIGFVDAAGGSDGVQMLYDRTKMVSICDTLNLRTRMAQHASRASVEVYTHIVLREKTMNNVVQAGSEIRGVIEDGYVVRVMKNGVAVLVPKYGLEGFVYSVPMSNSGSAADACLVLHPTEPDTLVATLPSADGSCATIRLFDRVKVLLSVDIAGVSCAPRSKLVMRLVAPKVVGLTPEEFMQQVDRAAKKPKRG